MNTYQIVSTVGALLLYIPLAYQVWTGKVKQNLATWILWGIQDAIACAAIFAQGGNWYIAGAYTLGCIVILSCMVRSKNLTWGLFETITASTVAICLVGWYFSGPYLANVLSVAGLALATFPQIKDAWKYPETMPVAIYFGYTIVNFLATAGGNAWTVEERLYPVVAGFCCLIVAVLPLRKVKFIKPHSS